ncbi:MAG: sigma-70 family RNA polymerase sigma factor [Candidatus Deferrimicrobiaceae bacterium]
MAREEKELLHRAREGDTAAFGEIVRRYQSLVYSSALQVVRDPTAAQDIAQESFIAAYLSLKNLRSIDAFPAWLRKIARNMALAWRKEQGRQDSLGEPALQVTAPVARVEEVETERKEADRFENEIAEILASLSDSLRFPVHLCYLDDVPTAEAARFLGIKEGTLRKRLHDGKKKLQERIVRMAEKNLQKYRLPRDFARRCICGCRSARRVEHPARVKEKRR